MVVGSAISTGQTTFGLIEGHAISPAAALLTPSSFGRILNTFGPTESFGTSRQIQLAVRYDF
jgi:hypothetical protein